MDIDELREQIETQAILAIDEEELTALLEAAETVREADTCLSGWIRILSLDGHVLVQEQTTEGEILIRRMASLETAEYLVGDRLATYERMWDGCGCKVDYRDESTPRPT